MLAFIGELGAFALENPPVSGGGVEVIIAVVVGAGMPGRMPSSPNRMSDIALRRVRIKHIRTCRNPETRHNKPRSAPHRTRTSISAVIDEHHCSFSA